MTPPTRRARRRASESSTAATLYGALDLCLRLVDIDLGSAANGLARRLVVPTHRPGGQAQFVAPLNPPGLGPTLEWARVNLDKWRSVESLAARAGLSSRQLARRIHAELRASPPAWLHQERIGRATELLESTDTSVEMIASRCGMGSPATLRRQFRRAVGVSPTAYRVAFRR